jgi:hypothetical protein
MELLGVVANICNPSTQEAEAGGWKVWGQPELHNMFKACLGYIETLSQKKEKHEIIHFRWIQVCKLYLNKQTFYKGKKKKVLK